MAGGKPLTKTSLIAALKEFGVATKKDVQNAIFEFWDKVLSPVMATKDDVKELRGEMNDRFDKVETDLSDVHRQLNDIKADVPTRKEFGQLKERVDSYHSAAH